MFTEQKEGSFGALFQQYKERHVDEPTFLSACHLFIYFDQTKVVTERLVILYILYAYYAHKPLTQNPFLTFFLEFIMDQGRGDWMEQHFVHAILEGWIDTVEPLTPTDVFHEPDIYIPMHPPTTSVLNELKRAVARLLDENDDQMDTSNTELTGNKWTQYDDRDRLLSDMLTKIQNDKLDPSIISFLSDLLFQATTRTLTIPENEVLIQGSKLHPYVVNLLPLAPRQLPKLIELNHFLAADLVPMILTRSMAEAYLHFLAMPKVTCNSLEVIHHVLTTHQQRLPDDFLHAYISSAIQTCELLEGSWQERQVRMVAKFLQSLLERHILPITDYMIEIQSFCLGYLKIRGVASLFRTVSQEASIE
ncbi:uncharacterized protein BX664DRAFT_389360 [Halteromyces radiatus]|uniref:uncharacterized protein n=1 Tax=Halteromyces radiatus TaxID=101107 RepID=UPI00221FE45E|nr:uncharacterized protein BX664DRAFT_389360 [Halteromyces radiatus]KAI8077765.1 hypothetical protein BX664DRAFT_389360 [Halteromyces radiatus]